MLWMLRQAVASKETIDLKIGSSFGLDPLAQNDKRCGVAN